MSTDFLGASRRRADSATLTCIFVFALTMIPAALVIRGLPVSLTLADILGLGLAIFWFCAQLTTSLGAAKGSNAVRSALFLYLVTVLLTYGYATGSYLPPDELRLADHRLVDAVGHIGIALVLCDGVRRSDRLDFILKAVVVSCAIVAFIGVLQFLLRFDVTRYLTFPIFRVTAETGIAGERNNLLRAAGTTAHPIEFSILCVMISPLALHYSFHSRGWQARGWLLCAATIAAGLMFSVSRSAVVLVAGVGIVLLIGWTWRQRALALATTVAFLGIIKLVVPGLLGTFYGLFAYATVDPSITFRTQRYPLVAQEIAKNFWLGRGVGTYYWPKFSPLDNEYLLTAVDAGIIGLLAFIVLLLAGIYAALRARSLTADPVQRHLALALAAGLVGPMIGAATADVSIFKIVTGLMFLMLGASGALLRIVQVTHAHSANLPGQRNGQITDYAGSVLHIRNDGR